MTKRPCVEVISSLLISNDGFSNSFISFLLYLATRSLGRTAAVVRDGSDVGDGEDLEAGSLEGTDSGFPARARALDFDVDLTEASVEAGLGDRAGSDLGGKRRGLPGAGHAAGSGAGPGDDAALLVGDGNDGVGVGSVDMGNTLGESELGLLLADRRLLSLGLGGLGSALSDFSHCCYLSSLADGGLLVVGDRLSGALAGPGVRLVSLTAAGKASLVPVSAVGSDLLESLDVEGDFPAEIAFDDVLGDLVTDGGKLFLAAILDALGRIDLRIGADLLGAGQSDSVDVSQGIDQLLVVRDIDSCDSCHILFLSSLALSLLVLGVGADDHDPALALDDTALVANRLD